jgi:translocation and assembly module TamB
VAVTQGEVNFFGAKYTIDRGEIGFYNPTKSEPVLNVDLQTRIRGVLVTITFAGPANKLNLSYRSDPPLQSQDILALLTVGRAPDGSIVGGGSNVQSPTFLQGGGTSTALLGQAAAAPLTGRLQRLFGVSRLRIDPQLTGIENTAQARLTIEQQVSRDITVTFITNLNRTQQQVVSVQWDFSREFSAVAIRDENGVFGIDFFYRKRIK